MFRFIKALAVAPILLFLNAAAADAPEPSAPPTFGTMITVWIHLYLCSFTISSAQRTQSPCSPWRGIVKAKWAQFNWGGPFGNNGFTGFRIFYVVGRALPRRGRLGWSRFGGILRQTRQKLRVEKFVFLLRLENQRGQAK